MEWITENYLSLIGIGLAALALAKAITKITPSPVDDAIVAKVEAAISRFLPGR